MFFPQVTYEHGEQWWNDVDKGKLHRALSGNPTSSAMKHGELAEGNDGFGLRSISVILLRDL
jgi:hypothetical protein